MKGFRQVTQFQRNGMGQTFPLFHSSEDSEYGFDPSISQFQSVSELRQKLEAELVGDFSSDNEEFWGIADIFYKDGQVVYYLYSHDDDTLRLYRRSYTESENGTVQLEGEFPGEEVVMQVSYVPVDGVSDDDVDVGDDVDDDGGDEPDEEEDSNSGEEDDDNMSKSNSKVFETPRRRTAASSSCGCGNSDSSMQSTGQRQRSSNSGDFVTPEDLKAFRDSVRAQKSNLVASLANLTGLDKTVFSHMSLSELQEQIDKKQPVGGVPQSLFSMVPPSTETDDENFKGLWSRAREERNNKSN